MSPPKPTSPSLLAFLLISISTLILPTTSSSPLSTIAISHAFNQTVVCALVLPSRTGDDSGRHTLNCTSLPQRVQHYYPSGVVSYSAIAAGNGFLCALTSTPSSNVSAMRWWEFSDVETAGAVDGIPRAKRVYKGSPLLELGAGDSHVCGLCSGTTREVYCWRWPEFSSGGGAEKGNLTGIAVGGDFVCGLSDAGEIKCFGSDTNVVGKEPGGGNVSTVAAGKHHACAILDDGCLVCWGVGAPKVPDGIPFEFVSLALGANRTCALRRNETVVCWGGGEEDFALPDNLIGQQFISIEAKGGDFCGILTANYSLVCWGNEIFLPNPVVFGRVLPGPCETSCSCGFIEGSGNICSGGAAICRRSCRPPPLMPPAPSPSNSTNNPQQRRGHGGGGGAHKRRLAILVVGSLGLLTGLSALSGYLFFRFCNGSDRCQVHDSGRLEAPPPEMPSFRARPQADSVPLDRRLSEFLSKGHSSTIEEFPLHVLLTATDGFSEQHKIGSGSFGSVYRATLDDCREVAIKRAEPYASSSSYAAAAGTKRREDKEQAFMSELALLSRVNHKNLVRLLGFCTEGSERVLVYEFMANGTLHDHLHRLPVAASSPLAAWDARLRVALDAARGIEYLHKYAVPPIIHRDIKSSNILLDDVWTAKVSDFGLSLMGPDDDASHISLRAAGTVGYMDPEYYRLQYLTTKSDVYSFGVVLLELLSGYKAVHRHDDGDDGAAPRNVVDFAVPHVNADQIHRVLDPKLPPPKPCEIEAVQSVGYLAADCVCLEGRDRPSMSDIVNSLEWAVAAFSVAPSLSRSMRARSL